MSTRALFIYPADFDATTATRRVLEASKGLFTELKFFYWARNGHNKDTGDAFYEGIPKEVFLKVAPPRSIYVVWLTIYYQWWLLNKIVKYRPDFISAFYFYTAFPALIYKYLFNRNCKIVYDPRDYFAVCYLVHPIVTWILRLVDNVFMLLSDRVIFPDRQYFTYYGMFTMPDWKYFVIPNSTEDSFSVISHESIYDVYNIPVDNIIIPIIGYFSDSRGKDLYFKVIESRVEGVSFIVAGVIRDKTDEAFFRSQPNVIFLDKISYIHALSIMKQSTFVPLLYNPASLNNKHAIPTKFYDSLMVGTPVMVTYEQTDVFQLVKNHDLGCAIAYDDLDEFLEILDKFKCNQFLFNSDKLRQYFLQNYDFSIYKDGLNEFYNNLLNSKVNN